MTFIRNAWYAAARVEEIGESPLARTFLGEPVVLFRDRDGEVGALLDACPHRAVPLSMGEVRDGLIRCPYHAMMFDIGGVCRYNPHVSGPPEQLKARRYPTEERHGFVWIWMGDAERADPSTIVDYSLFGPGSNYTIAHDYLRIEADYRLVIDNLMDLAHAEFIHRETVGSPGAHEVEQAEIVHDTDSITVKTLWPDLPPNGVNRPIWTESKHVDAWQDMTWRAPGNLYLDLGVNAPGKTRADGIHTPSAHILTPETDRSTHYFWCFARQFAPDDPAVTAGIRSVVNQAFGDEDRPILEAAQRRIDQTGIRLTNLTVGDAGSARVRRRIMQLIAAEAGGEEPRSTTAAAGDAFVEADDMR